jgi:hypothetical protein
VTVSLWCKVLAPVFKFSFGRYWSLPWLLHKFAEGVQKTISGRGRILLEKK